jgi:hypothetical protein
MSAPVHPLAPHSTEQAKSAGQVSVWPVQLPTPVQSMTQVVPLQPPVQAAGQLPPGGVAVWPQLMH